MANLPCTANVGIKPESSRSKMWHPRRRREAVNAWESVCRRMVKCGQRISSSCRFPSAGASGGATLSTGPRSKSIQPNDCSMCNSRGSPSDPRRSQSNRRNVRSLDCCTSASTIPSPIACNCSRWDEQKIACRDFQPVQALLDCSAGQRLAQIALGQARLQTGINAARRVSRENHPGFGLAAFTGNKKMGLCIIRMHLHRKTIAGIQKFDEQRKLRDPGMPPQQLPCQFTHQPPQRPTVAISAGDQRLVCPMIADLPAFGVVASRTDGFSQQFTEPPAAPANSFQNGSAFEWIQAQRRKSFEKSVYAQGMSLV